MVFWAFETKVDLLYPIRVNQMHFHLKKKSEFSNVYFWIKTEILNCLFKYKHCICYGQIYCYSIIFNDLIIFNIRFYISFDEGVMEEKFGMSINMLDHLFNFIMIKFF